MGWCLRIGSIDSLGAGAGFGAFPAAVAAHGGDFGVFEEVDGEFGLGAGELADVEEEAVGVAGLGEGHAFAEAGFAEVGLEVEGAGVGFGGVAVLAGLAEFIAVGIPDFGVVAGD